MNSTNQHPFDMNRTFEVRIGNAVGSFRTIGFTGNPRRSFMPTTKAIFRDMSDGKHYRHDGSVYAEEQTATKIVPANKPKRVRKSRAKSKSPDAIAREERAETIKAGLRKAAAAK